MFQQFTQMFDDFKSYAEKYESEFNSLETKEISKSFRIDLSSQENLYNLYCDLPNIEKDVNISVNKDYVLYVPPIKPVHIVIEERNSESEDYVSEKKYVLKRTKPLSKKRNVMSSMQTNETDE